MKLGAENRNKLLFTIALMVVAIVLLFRAFSGDSAPAASTGSQQSTPPASAARALRPVRNGKPALASNSLDPTLRLDLLRASEQASYKGSGRNIFKAAPEPPPIPAPKCIPLGVAPRPGVPFCQPQGPPAPPPPPPINLKFFGFASSPGEPKRVFLSQGDDIFIAGEGDIVDRRYKVIRISPSSVEIEDVLNNHRETIALTQG